MCLALVGVPSCLLYIVDDDANAICTKDPSLLSIPFPHITLRIQLSAMKGELGPRY